MKRDGEAGEFQKFESHVGVDRASQKFGWLIARSQLAILGVPSPPKHGWRNNVVGKVISYEASLAFFNTRRR
jgi:hypothetical protein